MRFPRETSSPSLFNAPSSILTHVDTGSTQQSFFQDPSFPSARQPQPSDPVGWEPTKGGCQAVLTSAIGQPVAQHAELSSPPPSESEGIEEDINSQNIDGPDVINGVDALSYHGPVDTRGTAPFVEGWTSAYEPVTDEAELAVYPAHWAGEPFEVDQGARFESHLGPLPLHSQVEPPLASPYDGSPYDWREGEWDVIGEGGLAVPTWISLNTEGYVIDTAYFSDLPESSTLFQLGPSTHGYEKFGPVPVTDCSSSTGSRAPTQFAGPAYFISTGPPLAPPLPPPYLSGSQWAAYDGRMCGTRAPMDWLETPQEVTFSIGEPGPAPVLTPAWNLMAESPYYHHLPPASSVMPPPPLPHPAPPSPSPPPPCSTPPPQPPSPPPRRRLDIFPLQLSEPYCNSPSRPIYTSHDHQHSKSTQLLPASLPRTPTIAITPPRMRFGHKPSSSLHCPHNQLSQTRSHHPYPRGLCLSEQQKTRSCRQVHSSRSASSSNRQS